MSSGGSNIMGFISKPIVTIHLMLSLITSISTSSSYPKDFKRHVNPHIDWEPGLKEAARQVLLRNRNLSRNIRDKLLTAPIIGKENRALPFGDIAILARGQLFAIPEGFRFVQDPHQNDCIDCHASRFCKHNDCGVYQPHGSEKLMALWTVKRIRHRSVELGHIYEIEYTISPINTHTQNSYLNQFGGFDYNIPGHVFIVKINNDRSDLIKAYNPNEHFISNSAHWNNRKYIPAGLPPPPLDDYYLPLPSTEGNMLHPLKPTVYPSGYQEFLPSHHKMKPNNQYLPQKPMQTYFGVPSTTGTRPPYGKRNDLYKKLLESLAQKTSSSKPKPIPTKPIPHRFGAPTKISKPSVPTRYHPETTQHQITSSSSSTTHTRPSTSLNSHTGSSASSSTQTLPSTIAHVPTTAQQIPTPQIPTSFIPMHPHTTGYMTQPMTTILLPTSLKPNELMPTTKVTPLIVTHLEPILTTKNTIPYLPTKHTTPFTTTKLTTPYITKKTYVTTKQTTPLTPKQTTPSEIPEHKIPSVTTIQMTSTGAPKQATHLVTTKQTTPLVAPKQTTPSVTPKPTTHSVTPKQTTSVTRKPTTPSVPQKQTSSVTRKQTTTSVTPKQTTTSITPKQTTHSVTPKLTTPSETPTPLMTQKPTIPYSTLQTTYVTSKQTTTYVPTKVTTPYLTSKLTTSSVTTKETDTYTPPKQTTVYTPTKETTLYIPSIEMTIPDLTLKQMTTDVTTSLVTTPVINTTQIYSTSKETPIVVQTTLQATTPLLPTIYKTIPYITTKETPFATTKQSVDYTTMLPNVVLSTIQTDSFLPTKSNISPTDLTIPTTYFSINTIDVSKPIPTFFIDPTHPGYPRTTPITPFTETYNHGVEQTTTDLTSSSAYQNFTRPETTSITLTSDRSGGTTTLQLPPSTDRYFPESTPQIIKIPSKPHKPDTPFIKPNVHELPGDDYSDYELFPEDKNRSLITTTPTKTSTGSPKPTEEFLLHEDDYYPNKLKEEDLDKAIALFDKEFTQKPEIDQNQILIAPTVNKEFVDIFENGTSIPSNEDKDGDLFGEKLNTITSQIIPTVEKIELIPKVEKMEEIKNDVKIIYSGFFEPSTTLAITTEIIETTTLMPVKMKYKKHAPTEATKSIDEISTRQSLSTSVSYKVNKYKRTRAPTRLPRNKKATTVKSSNKTEIKYKPKHIDSKNDDSDLIQVESNNTKGILSGDKTKVVKYKRKSYARARKVKKRVEN